MFETPTLKTREPVDPRMGIFIPSDTDEPLSLVMLDDVRLQDLLGEAVDRRSLHDPEAILFTAENASGSDQDRNRRATVLTWVHSNGEFLARRQVHGPAVLIGPPSGDGLSSTVPESFLNTLIPNGRLQMQFTDAQVPGPWQAVGHDQHWLPAYTWMLTYLGQANRSTLRLRVRLVPALTGTELADVAGIGRAALGQSEDAPSMLGSATILSCTGVDDMAHQISWSRLRAGGGFHFRDLCLLNLTDEGEDWLAIRHGHGLSVPPLRSMIHDGLFADLVTDLLSLTRQQAAGGSY